MSFPHQLLLAKLFASSCSGPRLLRVSPPELAMRPPAAIVNVRLSLHRPLDRPPCGSSAWGPIPFIQHPHTSDLSLAAAATKGDHDTCRCRELQSRPEGRPQEAKEMGPALSMNSRGPISEPSEVESGAHRAIQLDRGPLLSLRPLSLASYPRNILDTVLCRYAVLLLPCRALLMAWPCGPSETNPHKARAPPLPG